MAKKLVLRIGLSAENTKWTTAYFATVHCLHYLVGDTGLEGVSPTLEPLWCSF